MRFILLAYPWLELLSLIQLGTETSAFTALLYVAVMIFLGITLMRVAGMAGLAQLQSAQRGGVLIQTALLNDMAMIVAGILLIIPGLLSDLLAVVILIGPLRRLLFGRWVSRVSTAQSAFTAGQSGASRPYGPASGPMSADDPDGVTLEGEFRRVDNDDPRIK